MLEDEKPQIGERPGCHHDHRLRRVRKLFRQEVDCVVRDRLALRLRQIGRAFETARPIRGAEH